MGVPLIRTLAHVCLKTTDLEKTRRFYCETLGIKKLFDFTKRGSVVGFYLKVSADTFIEVFLQDAAETAATHQNLHHFCLETNEIEKARAALLTNGHEASEIKLGVDGSYQCWTKDPNGVDVEFHQYTARSAQCSGRNVEVDW